MKKDGSDSVGNHLFMGWTVKTASALHMFSDKCFSPGARECTAVKMTIHPPLRLGKDLLCAIEYIYIKICV